MTGALYCRASTRTYIFHGRSYALTDLADRMPCARAYVLYRGASPFADALKSLPCAFYRRAGACSYVSYSLARALYRRAGAGAYISYSRSRTLADLADGVARSLSYVCYR